MSVDEPKTARCPWCGWFKTPNDRLARAIWMVHVRERHPHQLG